jgi:Ca2+-binding RTX toxin-like protein
VHNFSIRDTDVAGNAGSATGTAIYGSTGNDVLVSGLGDDLMAGGGGIDTFVFSSTNFGNDAISDFAATTRRRDVIQFSESAFASFAAVMAHTSQVGADSVIIQYDSADSVTLVGVQMSRLTASDFRFA